MSRPSRKRRPPHSDLSSSSTGDHDAPGARRSRSGHLQACAAAAAEVLADPPAPRCWPGNSWQPRSWGVDVRTAGAASVDPYTRTLTPADPTTVQGDVVVLGVGAE